MHKVPANDVKIANILLYNATCQYVFEYAVSTTDAFHIIIPRNNNASCDIHPVSTKYPAGNIANI